MVLLHEARSNPVAILGENLEDLLHTHVLGDLLHKTLQNSVLEVHLEDLHSGDAAATPPRPALPCRRRLTASVSATTSVRYACTGMPVELVQVTMARASTLEPPGLRGRANPPMSTRTDLRT